MNPWITLINPASVLPQRQSGTRHVHRLTDDEEEEVRPKPVDRQPGWRRQSVNGWVGSAQALPAPAALRAPKWTALESIALAERAAKVKPQEALL